MSRSATYPTPVSARTGRRRRRVAVAAALLMATSSLALSAAPAHATGEGNKKGHEREKDHKGDQGGKRGRLVDLQLLAFNDYHGHLEASTPGAVAGAAAGGAEYLSAKLDELQGRPQVQPHRGGR